MRPLSLLAKVPAIRPIIHRLPYFFYNEIGRICSLQIPADIALSYNSFVKYDFYKSLHHPTKNMSSHEALSIPAVTYPLTSSPVT